MGCPSTAFFYRGSYLLRQGSLSQHLGTLKRYKQERSGKVTLHCIGCICWTFLCVFKCFEAAGTLRRYLQAGDFRSAEIYSQRREGLTQRLLLAAVNQIYNILLTRSIVYNTVTQIDNTLHYCCRPDRTMYNTLQYCLQYRSDKVTVSYCCLDRVRQKSQTDLK